MNFTVTQVNKADLPQVKLKASHEKMKSSEDDGAKFKSRRIPHRTHNTEDTRFSNRLACYLQFLMLH